MPPSSPRRRGSSTSLRGVSTRLRNARSSGSPPVASDARTSPRTSSERPWACGPQPARAPLRPRGGDRLDQLARALELLGGHAREVACAQELVRRPPGRLELVPGALRRRAGRRPAGAARAAEAASPASARPPPAGTRRGTHGRTSRGPRRARQASGAASSRRRPDGARSITSSPRSASETRPGPTSSPAARSTRPNVTTCSTTALSATARGDEPGQPLVPDEQQVLVVLQHGAERRLDVLASSSCSPSAVSARAQSIVSASPGGFCRSSCRSSAAKRPPRRRAAPGRRAREAR